MTLSGRQRPLADISLNGPENSAKRAYAERQAVNTVIQGTAADIIKRAMKFILLDLKKQGLAETCTLCLQIHGKFR